MIKNIVFFFFTFLFLSNSFADDNARLHPDTDKYLKQCFSNLKPFEIEYEMSASVITANSKHTLSQNGEHWTYHSEASKSLVGKITETSKFKLDNGHFRLNEYDSYRRLGWNTNERTLNVDWKDNIIRASDRDDKSFSYDTVFDKASQQLAIQCLIRQGFYSFELPIIDRNGVTVRGYKVKSIDQITTPKGDYESIKVAMIRDDSREIVFWIAPELDYIPIQFIYYEDGDEEFKAQITNYNSK